MKPRVTPKRQRADAILLTPALIKVQNEFRTIYAFDTKHTDLLLKFFVT